MLSLLSKGPSTLSLLLGLNFFYFGLQFAEDIAVFVLLSLLQSKSLGGHLKAESSLLSS